MPLDLSNYYETIFNTICKFKNEIIKDYVISGLANVNLLATNGWSYVFPIDPTKILYNNYIPFQSTHLIQEFRNIANCSFIQDIIKRYLTENNTFENVFESEILPAVYLIRMFPGTTGFITPNKRIFIKDYSYNNTDDSARGAIYVVLLHEIIHYVRRLPCKTRTEFSMAKTPPTEIYAKDGRGEAGFEAETIIFGSPVAYITDSAARELIRHDHSDLNDFKKKFIGANIFGEEKKVIINRAGGRFKGVLCPMKNFDKIWFS